MDTNSVDCGRAFVGVADVRSQLLEGVLMDRKQAERAAAQIVREAKEFTAKCCTGHVSQQESVWFLVGVLRGEITTLLEGRHSAQRENCNAEN